MAEDVTANNSIVGVQEVALSIDEMPVDVEFTTAACSSVEIIGEQDTTRCETSSPALSSQELLDDHDGNRNGSISPTHSSEDLLGSHHGSGNELNSSEYHCVDEVNVIIMNEKTGVNVDDETDTSECVESVSAHQYSGMEPHVETPYAKDTEEYCPSDNNSVSRFYSCSDSLPMDSDKSDFEKDTYLDKTSQSLPNDSPISGARQKRRRKSTTTTPVKHRKDSIGRFTITPVSKEDSLKSKTTRPQGSFTDDLPDVFKESVSEQDSTVSNQNNSNSKTLRFQIGDSEPSQEKQCMFFIEGDGEGGIDNDAFTHDKDHAGKDPERRGSFSIPDFLARSKSVPSFDSIDGALSRVPKLSRQNSESVIHDAHGHLFNARDSVRLTKHTLSNRPHYMRFEEAEAVLERKQALEVSMISQTLEAKPNDYLPFACAVMLCCNPPVGLIALFFSVSSNSYYEKQQYEMSKKHSRLAFILSIAGCLITLVLVMTFLIIFWPSPPVSTIH